MSQQSTQTAGPYRLLYSVKEAAALIGIGRTFMYQLVGTGEIESLKVGKHRKIPRDALSAYIERLRAEQVPAGGSRAPGTRILNPDRDPTTVSSPRLSRGKSVGSE